MTRLANLHRRAPFDPFSAEKPAGAAGEPAMAAGKPAGAAGKPAGAAGKPAGDQWIRKVSA
ncbi:hypothetical protein [Mesobacterium pallidum]|uniref:hypothetical protein n=1 Tax=Mesobacterium pallidum TaxID=2872037 RepID=UPI001EE18188|nr:hypothetical protein [Mesobacterium pallidum]